MADIITIRPKKDSKAFKGLKSQITQFNKIEQNGREIEKDAGEYKRERFPNSRQMFRPMWSASKRRWMLKGYTGRVDEKMQKELDSLVKRCKLRYPDSHPKAKTPIETADIFDSEDAFFNHVNLKVIAYEGEVSLDKSRPMDQILLKSFEVNNDFEKGGESINPILSKRTKYIITDKGVDAKIKKQHRGNQIKTVKLYEALDDNKRMKIAMAMGLISNESVDRTVIDEVLWDASQDNKRKASGNMTRQDLFIKMCEATSEELNTRHLIHKAKAGGYLKRHRQQGWLLFGEAIAATDGLLYEYFNNPENQHMMIRLEQAMEND